MNYKRVYDQLIESAKSSTGRSKKHGYFEKHHIVPRSMGGTNKKTNLVLLTAREHFIAHHLLHKHYGGGMTLAFDFMSRMSDKYGDITLTGKEYQIIKEQRSIQNSIFQKKRFEDPEECRKISERQKKLWSDPVKRERMIREVCRDPKRCERISSSVKKYIEENQEEFQARVLKINKDPEKIRKMAEKHRGMKRTDETKKNQSESKKRFIEANGTEWIGKGCVYIHNPSTGERKRVSSDFVIPEGWKTGLGKQNKKKPSGVNMYIKNMELMIEKVITIGSEIPEGWVKGRLRNG
jgi:hypothetical protein